MLKTIFGNVKMFFDNEEARYDFVKIDNYKSFLDTETYSVNYKFERKKTDENKKCSLKCILETDIKHEAYVEAGERLEAISFDTNKGKLTIGTVSGLSMAEIDGNNNDFDVQYLNNGIEILIFEETKNQNFCFGVSFMEDVKGENEVQTWLGADYALWIKGGALTIKK